GLIGNLDQGLAIFAAVVGQVTGMPGAEALKGNFAGEGVENFLANVADRGAPGDPRAAGLEIYGVRSVESHELAELFRVKVFAPLGSQPDNLIGGCQLFALLGAGRTQGGNHEQGHSNQGNGGSDEASTQHVAPPSASQRRSFHCKPAMNNRSIGNDCSLPAQSAADQQGQEREDCEVEDGVDRDGDTKKGAEGGPQGLTANGGQQLRDFETRRQDGDRQG